MGIREAREGAAQEARDLHLRAADPGCDLALHHVVREAHVERFSLASWKRPEEGTDRGGAIDQFVAVVLGAENVGERVGGLVVVLEGSVERWDVQRDVVAPPLV